MKLQNISRHTLIKILQGQRAAVLPDEISVLCALEEMGQAAIVWYNERIGYHLAYLAAHPSAPNCAPEIQVLLYKIQMMPHIIALLAEGLGESVLSLGTLEEQVSTE